MIELMIVVAIIPILTIPLATMMNYYQPVFAQIEADRQMADQARTALAWIGRDIRTARAVLPKAGAYVSGERTLVLKSGDGAAKLLVWTSQYGALERMEFSDETAKLESSHMVLAPRGRLSVALPARSGLPLGVTVQLARTIMDRERKTTLSGVFAVRTGLR